MRANVMEWFRSGAIAYEPENAEVIMELVGARDNSVRRWRRGADIDRDAPLPASASSPVYGRGEAVNGKWMLAIRQATIFSVQ